MRLISVLGRLFNMHEILSTTDMVIASFKIIVRPLCNSHRLVANKSETGGRIVVAMSQTIQRLVRSQLMTSDHPDNLTTIGPSTSLLQEGG